MGALLRILLDGAYVHIHTMSVMRLLPTSPWLNHNMHQLICNQMLVPMSAGAFDDVPLMQGAHCHTVPVILAISTNALVLLDAVLDVMRRLLQPKNIMVSAHARTKEYDKSKYISILNIIQVQFSLPLLWSPCVYANILKQGYTEACWPIQAKTDHNV